MKYDKDVMHLIIFAQSKLQLCQSILIFPAKISLLKFLWKYLFHLILHLKLMMILFWSRSNFCVYLKLEFQWFNKKIYFFHCSLCLISKWQKCKTTVKGITWKSHNEMLKILHEIYLSVFSQNIVGMNIWPSTWHRHVSLMKSIHCSMI